VLGIAAGHVSVKGKTNEGMGWIGRGEGVATMAVALIDSIDPLDPRPSRRSRRSRRGLRMARRATTRRRTGPVRDW
jgi:hypothetical protein